MAAGQTVPNGELRDRVDQVLAVLGELGGLAQAEERRTDFSSGVPAAPSRRRFPAIPRSVIWPKRYSVI